MARIILEPIERVAKAWGEELWIVNTSLYCAKWLVLNQGWQCSLHHHKIKDETFHILEGLVKLELGDEIVVLSPGNTVHVPTGTKHRFAGLEASHILEISTHHSDGDVFRDEPSRPMVSDPE